jgi:chlorite dismutase
MSCFGGPKPDQSEPSEREKKLQAIDKQFQEIDKIETKQKQALARLQLYRNMGDAQANETFSTAALQELQAINAEMNRKIAELNEAMDQVLAH